MIFFYLENVYFDIIMIRSIEIDRIKITDNLIKISDTSVEFGKNEVLEFIRYGFGEQNFVQKVEMYKKTFYITIDYGYVAFIFLSLDSKIIYKINFLDLIDEFNYVGTKIYDDSKYFCLVKKIDIKNTLNGKISNKHFSFDKEKDIFIYRLNDRRFDDIKIIFSKKEFYDFYFKKKAYEKDFVVYKNYRYDKVKIWRQRNLIIYGFKFEYDGYISYMSNNNLKDIIEKYRTYIMYNFYYKKIINVFNNRYNIYLTDNIFEFIFGISLLKNN